MNAEIDRLRTMVKIERAAKKPRVKRIEALMRDAEALDRLVENDFPSRFIWVANLYPRGTIARTLLAKKKARRRAIRYRRARIEAYPVWRMHPKLPRIPPVPETRRMRPWVR